MPLNFELVIVAAMGFFKTFVEVLCAFFAFRDAGRDEKGGTVHFLLSRLCHGCKFYV